MQFRWYGKIFASAVKRERKREREREGEASNARFQHKSFPRRQMKAIQAPGTLLYTKYSLPHWPR